MAEATVSGITMGSRGVYSILCIPERINYFGQSMRSIENRFSWHKSQLKNGKHNNPFLQEAYNKYGAAAFQYRVEFLTNDKFEAKQEEQNLILHWENFNYYHDDVDWSARNRAIAEAHAITRKTPEWKAMQSDLTTKQHLAGKFKR
jgi:hypothetical protein